MSAPRARHAGTRRSRVQVERGATTTYRAIAPPLLGFVRSAGESTVVHLTYRTLHEVCGREPDSVATLCGQHVTAGGAEEVTEEPPPPCPMCLDTAMNDTASTDAKAG